MLRECKCILLLAKAKKKKKNSKGKHAARKGYSVHLQAKQMTLGPEQFWISRDSDLLH
jgi:hypothetical protein